MIRDVHLKSRIRIQIFISSRIPDPGVKKALDSGSGSATLAQSSQEAILSARDKNTGFMRIQDRVLPDLETRIPNPYFHFLR